MYADMADGDSKHRLKLHLDARVDIYLRENVQPSPIRPLAIYSIAAGGVVVALLGISSLLIDDLDVGWSLTIFGAGVALVLIGGGLVVQTHHERHRADKIRDQLEANRLAAAQRLASGEPRDS